MLKPRLLLKHALRLLFSPNILWDDWESYYLRDSALKDFCQAVRAFSPDPAYEAYPIKNGRLFKHARSTF